MPHFTRTLVDSDNGSNSTETVIYIMASNGVRSYRLPLSRIYSRTTFLRNCSGLTGGRLQSTSIETSTSTGTRPVTYLSTETQSRS